MMNTKTQMREARTALAGEMRCHYGAEESCRGQWLDLSRTGAALRLGRYLRPGRRVRLAFASPLTAVEVTMPAQVVWCRPLEGGTDFVAGVRVLRACPESAVAFAALGYQQRAAMNTQARNAVVSGVWPHFRAVDMNESQQLSTPCGVA